MTTNKQKVLLFPRRTGSIGSTPETERELTVRDAVSIEPRSGHTAVLSEDGNKVDASTLGDP
jgi:hypothetical protein